MIHVFNYLKRFKGYIIFIMLLLFVQAYCDLSLPTFTSNIVNVGIQQKGIENSVPIKLTNKTYMFLSNTIKDNDDKKLFIDSYEKEKDGYVLKKHLSSKKEDKLNEVLTRPMAMNLFASKINLKELSKLKNMENFSAKDLEKIPPSMLKQVAIASVGNEYKALGIDMEHLQNMYILKTGLWMLLFSFIMLGTAVSVTLLSAKLAAFLGRDMRKDIYSKVMRFSSSEFNDFSTASLITRCTNDVTQIQTVMTFMFRLVLYAPILGIGGVIKVMETDNSMTWILGVGVGIIILVVLVLFQLALPAFSRLQDYVDRVNQVIRETLWGVPLIRALGRKDYEENRFDSANKDLTKTTLFVNRVMSFMMPSMMLIMNGISLMIIYFGARQINNGTMQVGNMMAFIQYAMQIIMSFLMITAMSIMLPRANVSGNRIYKILKTTSPIKEPEKEVLPKEEGTVEFRNVSFAYNVDAKDVISNISFKINKGETFAIIGSTGSGKSTLISLIPRFYDSTKGEVIVDGVNVRDMSTQTLRDKIGYVPQKSFLFKGTVRSNIGYGEENLDKKLIEEVAKVSSSDEFIAEKEKGFESEVSSGGENLSGGQKQRLAIARALAKEPEIIIFDDSFSALDFATDKKVRNRIKEFSKNMTKIIVAQRVSTIIDADNILVLDNGEVAGLGTHSELLKTCEVYREIASSQNQGGEK